MIIRPFVPAALELLQDLAEQDVTENLWLDHKRNSERQNSPSYLHNYIKDVSNNPSGMTLPRPALVKLNRQRTGVGLFRVTMHKWGMVDSSAKEHSANHIITSGPTHHFPHGTLEILHLDIIKLWQGSMKNAPTSEDILNTSTLHEEESLLLSRIEI